MRVGLVSDTHGRFDPSLPSLLNGCDIILHAGDVMGQEILHELEALAPVTAVLGNNDSSDSTNLSEMAVLQIEELKAIIIHDIGRPDRLKHPVRDAIEKLTPDLVIFGHTHEATVELFGGILYVNPGSVGIRRSYSPRSAAILTITGRSARVELFNIERPDLPFIQKPFEVSL